MLDFFEEWGDQNDREIWAQRWCAFGELSLVKGGDMYKFAIAAASIIITSSASAQSYNRIGDTTFSSDGTTYNHVGNTTFGSDGSSRTRIGDTTFSSDGTTYNRIGDNTFGSDGSSSTRIGNSTFIRDGQGNTKTCNTIGSTTICN